MWSRRTDTDILKTSMRAGGATLPFSIGCRTDVMAVVRRARVAPEAGIVATLEMKKKVVRQTLRQTKATYICASLKSQLPVISCVTDLVAVAVAYYTSGQKRADGATIVVEHIFNSVDGMLAFLQTALGVQSVSPTVLQFRNVSEVDLPDELPNPKRVRLPVPNVQLDKIQPQLLANLFCVNDDVARMADVEGMCPGSDTPFYIS